MLGFLKKLISSLKFLTELLRNHAESREREKQSKEDGEDEISHH